jgi:hypothetical protein
LGVRDIEPKGLKAQKVVFLPVPLIIHIRKISEISHNSLGISSPAVATLLSHRTSNCKKTVRHRAVRKKVMSLACQRVFATFNQKQFTDKENNCMWNFMTQSGPATALVDFTKDLWPLGVGLFALLALSAGPIMGMAVRHYLAEQIRSKTEAESAARDHREAA